VSGYHDDREQLTEMLSAYLDGALTSAEREALERHLAGCAECQEELAGLIRVGALLRALPEPALPRSFTLPEPGAAHGGRSLPVRSARRVSAWSGAAQWVGGLAAALGAGILLAGVLPPLGFGGAASTASHQDGRYGGASTSAPTAQPHVSPSAPVFAGSPGTNTVTPTVTATATATPPTPTATGSATNGPVEPADSGAPLAPVGAVLLIGGGAALAIGTVTRRRERRDQLGT
jgi:anti-sigma factor RsiW